MNRVFVFFLEQCIWHSKLLCAMSSRCSYSSVSFLHFGFDDESRNIGMTAQTRNSNMAASTGVQKTGALEASSSALFLTRGAHMCRDF